VPLTLALDAREVEGGKRIVCDGDPIPSIRLVAQNLVVPGQ
jgi:hypothetical protein